LIYLFFFLELHFTHPSSHIVPLRASPRINELRQIPLDHSIPSLTQKVEYINDIICSSFLQNETLDLTLFFIHFSSHFNRVILITLFLYFLNLLSKILTLFG
jgi:hypothetical protein